jgi:hypothetical protein
MNSQTACAVQPDFNSLFVFMLCLVCFLFGMIILGMIFNRISRVQDEAAEKYSKKLRDELKR